MDTDRLIGFIAGIFTGISLLPQLIKIIKEKKTENISALMLLILMVGLTLWIIYGFVKNDLPIIITNAFSLIINLIIIFFRFKYKNSR
ncbi:MAG: SemiSWEET transporter [Bacteroidota bacterium]|nr:SemiSWEET transporter [Bacteroidota bacterium]